MKKVLSVFLVLGLLLSVGFAAENHRNINSQYINVTNLLNKGLNEYCFVQNNKLTNKAYLFFVDKINGNKNLLLDNMNSDEKINVYVHSFIKGFYNIHKAHIFMFDELLLNKLNHNLNYEIAYETGKKSAFLFESKYLRNGDYDAGYSAGIDAAKEQAPSNAKEDAYHKGYSDGANDKDAYNNGYTAGLSAQQQGNMKSLNTNNVITHILSIRDNNNEDYQNGWSDGWDYAYADAYKNTDTSDNYSEGLQEGRNEAYNLGYGDGWQNSPNNPNTHH